jgi:glucokinase
MSVKERYIVGVDLGGTNIVAGAMPLDGSREIAMHTIPTLADGGAASVVDRIAGMIEEVIAQTKKETGAQRSDFLGVGIGSPGPLDREKGIVIVTPNLGWKNFPLRDEIAKRVGLEATLDNDANCATLGEFWCGAAVGGRNVIGMTLGT